MKRAMRTLFLCLLLSVLPGGISRALADTGSAGPTELEKFSEHKVTCEDCPPHTATIISMGMFGRSFCRGALIDPQHVSTSAHCVEGYVEDCSGLFAVKIGSNTYACEKIEYNQITENDAGLPDIAVIKLKEIAKETPGRLKASKFRDGQRLHYYKSTYEFSKDFAIQSSTMKRVDCRAKKFTSAIGDFVSSMPSVVTLGDCPYEEGDSGSPIYNEDDEIVAFLHGGLPKEALEAFAGIKLPKFQNQSYLDLLKANYNDRESKEVHFAPVIAATTVACTPSLGGKVCRSKNYVDYTKHVLNKIKIDFRSRIEKANKNSRVRWGNFSDKAFDELLEQKPPTQYSMDDFRKVVRPEPICRNRHGRQLVPTLLIKVSVDTFFRIYYDYKVDFVKEQVDGDLPECSN
jgi:hypothetical protein